MGITKSDFSCHICMATSFTGEESWFIDTGDKFGLIRVCAMCGVGAESLGWRLI
jgi:hypothetical protein